MRDFKNALSLPVVVTAIGLILATILGIAPLIGRDTPTPKAVVEAPAAAPSPIAETDPTVLAAIQSTVAGQGGAIDSMDNRVRTLEKGITRLNQRLARQGGTIESLAGLPGDVARTEGQITILNKAVPRINARVLEQATDVAALPELQKQVAFLEGQMRILNAAVPKLQARIRALQDAGAN